MKEECATKALCCAIVVLAMGGCATTPPQSSLQAVAKEMVKKNPNSPDRWVDYGRTCLYTRDPKEAEQAFRKAHSLG